MTKSKIAWTDRTWNPITGCNKISAGCLNCYAERQAFRIQKMEKNKGIKRYENGFQLTLHPDKLLQPTTWKKGCKIFVCSMSDIFHDQVPDSYIKQIFQIMSECPQHTFQLLTKRSTRMKKLAPQLHWADNIWMGVTVESAKYIDRISDLNKTSAKVKFISFEPLIGSLMSVHYTLRNLSNNKIDWFIVGGESGHNARPMKAEWLRTLFNCAAELQIPLFFKQWGSASITNALKQLDGKDAIYRDQKWHQFPEVKS